MFLNKTIYTIEPLCYNGSIKSIIQNEDFAMDLANIIATRPEGTVVIAVVESEEMYSYFDNAGNIWTQDDEQWESNHGWSPEDSIESLSENDLVVKVIFDIRGE